MGDMPADRVIRSLDLSLMETEGRRMLRFLTAADSKVLSPPARGKTSGSSLAR